MLKHASTIVLKCSPIWGELFSQMSELYILLKKDGRNIRNLQIRNLQFRKGDKFVTSEVPTFDI